MKTGFKHSASVEQFLSGDMGHAERENFENEVASNRELAGELKFSKSIDAVLKREDIIDFRKKLIAARMEGKKVQHEVPVIRMHVKKFWYAAASLILLAAIGSTLYFSVPRGNATDTLFKEYYSADNLVNVTRAGDANIVEAVIKFQEKDFAVAASQFNNILKNDNGNIACWFYYGISCIETENFTQAEKAFNKIISDNQNLYVEHAEWYLGLTYLKNNQINKAKTQFETIASNPDNYHRKDAANLLKKLN
jgi:tetratricopeptide (TPR) repeat protein